MNLAMPEWAWVPVTLFAVVMQSVRTAGQKQLTAHLDAACVTLARFLFGLPFACMYLGVVLVYFGLPLPPLTAEFALAASVAAVGQIVATVLLIYLFSLRNFAVGTTYARTEAFLTALIGAAFFGELIGLGGWLAILISVLGVVVLTVARNDLSPAQSRKQRWYARIWNRTAVIDLGSGLFFAIASLCLRKASLSIGIDNPLYTAGVTLVTMVVIQTGLMLIWVAIRTPFQLTRMARQWRLSLFVGVTSALGSVGWFVAMTLERASYVKALGQIEFVLALAISSIFFKERSSHLELVSMGFIAAGIATLLIVG